MATVALDAVFIFPNVDLGGRVVDLKFDINFCDSDDQISNESWWESV